MRGKAGCSFTVCCAAGITPAYAGKRNATPAENSILEDHPRVCGEKRFKRDQNVKLTGSPPRMRGKVVLYRKCLP